MDWSIVMPLKPPAVGKTRLRDGSLDERAHAALVLAFAQDAIAAALRSPGVARVLLVCSPQTADAVRHARLDGPGALREEDAARIEQVADQPGAGLLGALRLGEQTVRARWPQDAIAALLPDLPSLTPAALGAVLGAALSHPRAFVPDATGTGTTLLCALPGTALDPRFGAGSAAAHAASGAAALDADPRLRQDVDTREDLAATLRLGVGPATAAVLGAVAPAEFSAGADPAGSA
jgi:2-phospho-L-lactate guanylyltransferase